MFKKLTVFGLVLALIVIVLGAYVRLSDAGLGCPDWPGCYGHAVVSDDEAFKAEAVQAFPGKIVDVAKALKEMSHRYLASGLGLVVLVLAGLAFRAESQRRSLIAGSGALVALVALQAALGMWTVALKTMPVIVTSHLLLGMMTVWLLFWLCLRLKPVQARPQRLGGLAVWLVLGAVITVLQIVLGGWVSANHAALACIDFPRCDGAWLPDADYATALNFLQGLISGYSGDLPASAQLAAHWLHRAGAVVSFIVLTLVMMQATSEQYPKAIRRWGLALSVLLLLQILFGILNIRQSLPMWTALAHHLFAALLMLPLIAIDFYSRYQLAGVEEEVIAAEAGVGDDADLIADPQYQRLKSQLQKTRSGFTGNLLSVLLRKKTIDADLMDELEATLLMADVGMETTMEIITGLTERLERDELKDAEVLRKALKDDLLALLQPCSVPLQLEKTGKTFVILIVGVNGAGKTTTIGKLAKRFQDQGLSVMLAAGDTFRAAAVEQLQVWGERNGVHVVAQHTGADSASVIFDSLQSAQAKGIDVLIADTAGRLHNKSNLMEELKKIKRIMAKIDDTAPHEVLLVLDAGTGQNALSQAKLFNESVALTGLALTKLDGTAKGGVIFALARQMGVPIRFIGVGEGIEDLQDFNAHAFVEALFLKD